jgi:RNA polymerase sigma factor for flagellar operon FliA
LTPRTEELAMTSRQNHAPADGGAAIDDVWRRYKITGSRELRDRLVLQYAPLVKYVAGRVRSGLPSSVDVADLVSEGIFGLLDAVEKFDLDRGFEFPTYASARIRGAMLDALRAQDWVPRTVRDKARAVEAARVTLEERLGRVPAEEEVAAELGISVGALRKQCAQVSQVVTVPGAEDLEMIDGNPGPSDLLEDETARRLLVRHVRRLRQRDQIVVALYYYEGFTLAEIGGVLGITESRVSQLHSRAILALRDAVRDEADPW